MTCFWATFFNFWAAIGQHISANGGVYGTAAVAVALAAGKNMPPVIPKSLQDLWSWAYSTVQTALPMSHTNAQVPSSSSVPTPPVPTPAPNK